MQAFAYLLSSILIGRRRRALTADAHFRRLLLRGYVRHVTIGESPKHFVDDDLALFLTPSLFEMDERWNTHVRPIIRVLVEILLPLALIDGLYAAYLITREEYEKIKTYDNAEGSRQLLVTILPRKGPDSFDRCLSVLEVTEGQEHVAELIREEGVKCEQERAVRKNREKERIRELERKLKKANEEKEETKNELKLEKNERAKDKEELNKEKVTNIGLRTKVRACLKSNPI